MSSYKKVFIKKILRRGKMKIYIWRHSKLYSSWSMFDEPNVYTDMYVHAEVSVLANSKEEALELISKDKKWDIGELARIEPRVLDLTEPTIISKVVHHG